MSEMLSVRQWQDLFRKGAFQDMRKDEQGCWYVLVVHPKLLEALRREKKMT